MSPVVELADARRTTARVILAVVIALITTLVLFSTNSPIGAVSFAQQQTTSPGFQIKWVNPDEDSSSEVSAKDDDPDGAGTNDETYHLVAWVNELPPGYSVAFQYQSGSGTPTTIGNGTLVGDDTFERYWASSQMPSDGSYNLIAILFSDGNEVSRDVQAVTVNNADSSPQVDPRTERGETVEIIDPANGDILGFYSPGGDAPYAATLFVSHSDSPDDDPAVRAYYTVSSPGTEPAWELCGTESFDDSDNGVRCELEPEHSPESVTAVAAVAVDSPIPETPDVDSGDGHRVTGYIADPEEVVLDPEETDNQAVETCTPVITATVLDQFDNPVGGANIDVHAQGPDDSLAFDDTDSSGDSTSASKAPENHPTESARNCEGSPPGVSGTQGWHEDGTTDRKHIESTAPGTNDDGTFTFRLYSASTGETQITAWADEDGNDQLCSEEAQGDASVGWGQAAPAATGVDADQTSCPRPTATSTQTESPTQSPTQSPTESPTPSPTESPTPDPDPRDCTITGDSGDNTIRGTDGDDIICAGGGDDTVIARGGDDIIYGDGGHDSVRGNTGNDTMIGGSGGDTLRGGRGNDVGRGGGGNDTIRTYSGTDRLKGGNRDDVLAAGPGRDVLRGNAGDDTLNGGRDRDKCRGGSGRDTKSRCER